MTLLDELNQAQQKAVEYNDGHLLILAGAGTGKTTVVTKKIAYLIENKLATPENILALTFTDKAAEEMVDRVDKLLDSGYLNLQISTFHSFCQLILEKYGLDIGLPNKFKLLTPTDAWLLVRKNLDKFNLDYYRPLGNPSKHIHELIKHFNKCKDEVIFPQDYLDYAEKIKLDTDDMNTGERSRLNELANAFHTYNQLLLDNNCLDFSDLIFYTFKLFHDRPFILSKLQEQFKYILVDEFQDVNYSQYCLIQMLVGKNNKLTVVGDDDQSIYAFRGASVSNILSFKEDYHDVKEIVLTENYRSGQKILDLAYGSIQNNNPDRLEFKLNISKKLENVEKRSGDYKYYNFSSAMDEVAFVVEEIKKLKNEDEKIKWSDFAILVRANDHSASFVSNLEVQGIPYEFLASSGLYRQPIVLDCLNYLKVIDSYHESASVYRLLILPFLQLESKDIHEFMFFAKKKAISYFEAMKRVGEISLSKGGVDVINKLLSLVNIGMQDSKHSKPSVLVINFLENSGYFKYLLSKDRESEIWKQINYLNTFLESIKSFEENNPDVNVRHYLEHVSYTLESGDEGNMDASVSNSDSVKILTIHKAKGLEFKYVFVVNMVEDRFPSRRRGDAIEIPTELIKEKLPEGDFHFQEERRLFYVAMTRAKDCLYLTSAEDYGGARSKKVSRFLAELKLVPINIQIEEKNNLAFSSKNRQQQEVFFVHPKMYSFSQINSYQRCPYQYKLAHILHIPTKSNASFSFGQTIHLTLQRFYEKVQDLNSVKQDSLFGKVSDDSSIKVGELSIPSLDDLLKIYDESWIDDWYQNKTQKENYYKKGRELLKIYYATQENNWHIPVALEGHFKIKVGDYLINGKIDRIDKLDDGSLEIVDYKTGKAKEKLVGDDKNQLLIYQVAVDTLPEYNSIGKISNLTFHYLEDNIKLSFLGTEEEIDNLKQKILDIIGKIESGYFVATPSEHICSHCDFRDICEFRRL